jgi:hypothetical protein
MMSYAFTHKDHLTDDQLWALCKRTLDDVTLRKTLWYDGAPSDRPSWFDRIRLWWLAVVTGPDDTTVGVFWLNGYAGRTAQIHFAIFEPYRVEAVQIGKATMQWLYELGWLHSVYGLTPATHRHVFPFIEAIGFKILGKIPGACWVDRKQKHVDGVLSVYDFGRQQ